MGRYTDNLTRRSKAGPRTATNAERLVSAAIVRDGETHARGFKAHWQIRAALGDDDPAQKNFDDDEGFLTSTGRFVSRQEAVGVGLASGQLSPMWKDCRRDLLSSDINW